MENVVFREIYVHCVPCISYEVLMHCKIFKEFSGVFHTYILAAHLHEVRV